MSSESCIPVYKSLGNASLRKRVSNRFRTVLLTNEHNYTLMSPMLGCVSQFSRGAYGEFDAPIWSLEHSLAIRTLLYYLLVAEKALYFKGKPLNQASARPSAGGSLRHKNVIAAKELIDSCIFTLYRHSILAKHPLNHQIIWI
jgi:hypothetical protein